MGKEHITGRRYYERLPDRRLDGALTDGEILNDVPNPLVLEEPVDGAACHHS